MNTESTTLPSDWKSERALVGALIIDPEQITTVRGVVAAADFWDKNLGIIYQAIMDMYPKPPEYISLCETLESKRNGDGRSLLEHVGGAAYLTGLITSTVSSAYAESYAETVKRKSRQRKMIEIAAEIAKRAYEHGGPIEGLYDDVARLVSGAIEVTGANSHMYGSDELLVNYLVNQEKRAALRDDDLIQSGIYDLDAILGDIPAGILHVVAARPGVGKTLYMERVAEHNADRGHRVAFYHLELSPQFMLDRAVSRRARITVQQLRRGYRGQEVQSAMDQVNKWVHNMVYVHCAGWTAERIAADIQRLTMRGECELAIVDYLQKVTCTERSLNSAQRLGHVAEQLKIAAETQGIPIVTASQVSRDFKSRDDKRPRAEDLRNSGEIEEKANQLIVLHRPEERDGLLPDGTPEPIELHVEKNTQGPVGSCKVLHIAGYNLLVNMTRGA